MKTKKFSIILLVLLVSVFFGFSVASAGFVDGTIIGINIFPSGTVQLKIKKANDATFTADVDSSLDSTIINQILACALTAESSAIPVSVNISSNKINAIKLISE